MASNKITAEVVKITPKMAEQWLASNTHNRTLRESQIDMLIDVIQRGDWLLNGDAIRFAADGTLLDGQHRLWAISLAEVAVESLVIRGLPNETQATMDLGKRRNLADQLKLAGYTSGLNLASVINVKWKLLNDEMRSSSIPTVQQGLAILETYPDLVEATKVANRYHRRLTGSIGVVGAVYHSFSEVDPDAAEAFMESLIEGTDLKVGSPIYALRRHIETVRMNATTLAAYFIKAWNFYMAGTEVQHIMWRPVGKNPEGFPLINGWNNE